jgi:8-oxo-dGTP pyrophosphatase MutT (NUDIX family)
MPISDHLRRVRAKLGRDLLLMPAVTGLVFDAAGRLLLQHHADTRRWVTPGGSVDPDESPSDAVVRELWEETGLHVEPVGIAGVFGGPEFRVRYRNGDETAYVMVAFECRVRGGTLRLDGDESLELRWVGADEYAALALAPWARLVLPAIFAGRGRAAFQPVRWTPPDRS